MKHPCMLIITDLEGVGGVNNFNDYCVPSGYRNKDACRNLTEEVNAVCRGCFDGGFSSVVVLDGHGSGGSILWDCLDRRAYLQRGFPTGFTHPKGVYDAMAFVGQHSKAGSKHAQLAHTQTQECVDFRLNGLSIGEYGQLAICAAEAGVPTIFASGDQAFTLEASALTPDVAVVPVKEGLNDAPTDIDLPVAQVFAVQSSVMHYPPKQTLEKIYDAMKEAAVAFLHNHKPFSTDFGLKAPYVAQSEYRAGFSRLQDGLWLPKRQITTAPHATAAEALNDFYAHLEWMFPDGRQSIELK